MEKRAEEQDGGINTLSLGTQLRMAGAILLLIGTGLFKGEDANPKWAAARKKELKALNNYENAPPGPEKEEAHLEAQDAWRERNSVEAQLFDPKPGD